MAITSTTIDNTQTPTFDFNAAVQASGSRALTRSNLVEVQLNLGRLCNQACEHCHVDAGPKRTEIMSWQTMSRIIDWIERYDIRAVDITGGAPELNPHFRQLVDRFVGRGINIKCRCNLTVMFEPGQDDLAQWYAQRKIHVICSLPCYSQKNVDAQRGKGVFGKSIRALHRLNEAGYGSNPDLTLDLVYNPGGPFLPPAQESLESDYRQRLLDDFGIRFSNLFTLANLPINRFEHFLKRSGQLNDYQLLLENSFNADTLNNLMCRHLVSVDWLGKVYDCDFNQMLGLPLPFGNGRNKEPVYLWDIQSDQMTGNNVAIGPHCFGCTAGAGSSCGGALI